MSWRKRKLQKITNVFHKFGNALTQAGMRPGDRTQVQKMVAFFRNEFTLVPALEIAVRLSTRLRCCQ